MRIAFLVFNLDGMGGTSRSAITQANALAPHQDVRIVSVTRSADSPHYDIDPAVDVDYLVDVRDPKHPLAVPEGLVAPDEALALHRRESALVPDRWDKQFTALCDVAMEAVLPALDVDVAVTVTPGLLVAGVDLLPDSVVLVHQEHRSSSGRSRGLEPLLNYAPRADVVAMLTPGLEEWLHEQLGPLCPPTVVMPNPLPLGFHPRSRLDQPLILTAGRLVLEKQFSLLVAAFAGIADRVPEWRLRICGTGPERGDLVREIRKWGLWDRVELPGGVDDMGAEWAKASVAALTSRTEGFPLVVQEAMAAGVPVASFDSASGPREIIEHEVNGLLVGPQSVAGMSAALLRLTTDAELRAHLGQGALRTARQYDAAALAERWIGIFSGARARRAGRGRLTVSALHGGRRPAPGTGVSTGSTTGSVTPAQARHEALSCAVQAARATGAEWLVIPPHEHDTTIVVLPMTARDAFLAALVDADPPAYLSLRDPELNGWHERRGTIAGLGAELRRGRTSTVCLEPWPEVDGRASLLGQGCTIEVQFWERSVGGELVGPRRNPYADRMPAGLDTVEVEVEGVTVPTLPLMAAPTVGECRFPVDVVYTWVDGSDPSWNAAREQRLAAVTGTAQTRESSGQARFIAHDELRHSLRSIHLFAPWVRRIHLVTAGQVPEWLDTDHPMVNLVDHAEILPAEALPTFNSHAIETSLHRIDGLAEHFVYFNDDVLLGRPARPEQFFSPAGHIAVFRSSNIIGLSGAADAPPFLKAAWNNRRLLQEEFGAVITHNLAHTAHPHRVSLLAELEERFGDPLAATARTPFRSDTDVSLLSSLAQHHALLTGRAFLAEPDLTYVNLTNADVERQLARTLSRDQDFICLADHHDHALTIDQLDGLLAEFYRDYYPVAAPWERA
jgi:glycosyltransferase involved in cell wall biosynthesis